MVEPFELTPQEEDTIKELINIGIGKAANSLSEITDSKIRLTIPKIAIIPHTDIEDNIPEQKSPIVGSNMIINGELKGSGFLFFTEENANKLSQVLLDKGPSPQDIIDTINEKRFDQF
jgi:chemotaxis protein CheC